jgi:type IV secretory pathway VirJ component
VVGLAGAGVGTYARSVTTTAERLRDTRVKTDNALACVRADPGASPVLIAVMVEFANKADRATHSNDERTAVIEVEQAGDSAKVAAEADIGVADATRQVVLDAHLAICIAKAKL